MDLDIRQYKNRYGQNGLEGDVSKSKRSTSRPGGKALNQSSSGHPEVLREDSLAHPPLKTEGITR
jgi:hypothetical protein